MTLAAMQADFGRWLQAECPDAAARLGGGPGLAIYLNNYRSQLVTALQTGFPQLRRWLGDTAFLAAAARHVDAAPPSAWTLDAYGADFAATIAALHPDAPECAELAHIEWALAATFTVADAAPLARESLATVAWDTARFVFLPGLTLLPVTTNAAALWQSLASETAPPAARCLAVPGVVLLWRAGFNPSFRTIDQAEAEALGALRAGTSFGALCAALADAHGDSAGAALAGTWLGAWLRDGLITAIEDARCTYSLTGALPPYGSHHGL